MNRSTLTEIWRPGGGSGTGCMFSFSLACKFPKPKPKGRQTDTLAPARLTPASLSPAYAGVLEKRRRHNGPNTIIRDEKRLDSRHVGVPEFKPQARVGEIFFLRTHQLRSPPNPF